MFKKQQTPVSDNESQQSDPLDNMDFDTFNENYNLVYNMSKEFFVQCRKGIMKYLNFTKMGVKLNVGGVLGWLNNTQQSLEQPKQVKLDNLKKRKELEFETILGRIRELVSDMIDFECNFKQEFNETCQKADKPARCMSPSHKNVMKKFDQSMKSETTKQSEVTVKSTGSSKLSQDNEQIVEISLRKQLRRIVLPKPTNIKSSEPPPKDLRSVVDRITQKMVYLTEQMKLQKQRESKIIEIFNKNKIIVSDIDTSNPVIVQLEKELETTKSQLVETKNQLLKKKKEYDRLAARLLGQMARQDSVAGDLVFENDDYSVLILRKNKKKEIEKPKIVGLSCKSLLSYIYTLQERICTLIETNKRASLKREVPLHKMPSAINLNMSFTNVYSPIEVKNIINSSLLKKE